MALESLLVYVEADREQSNLVHVAADIASRYGSTIAGLCALGIRPPFVADGVVIGVGGDAEVDQMKMLLAAREAGFRSIAKKRGRAVEWRSAIESPTIRLIREAASTDLLLMSPTREAGDIYRRPDVGEVILRAGRPVMLVPDNVNALKAERVVVGWKSTREARRALADAVPFLARASMVTIIEICEHAEREAALAEVEDVKSYLRKHQVTSSYEFIVCPTGQIGEQLLGVARQTGADLIVTGAYGHTRLGEWIFGGATRELLNKSDICCLMSH